MAGGLHNASEDMDRDGKKTVECADRLSSELVSLRGNVDTLMANWKTGSARDEFNRLYDEQAHNLEEFQKFINDLGERISQSARIFAQREQDNIDMM